MPDTNQLLETLQADVLGVLEAVPDLALVNVIADNEGDIEAKVAKALATLSGPGGKRGLAAVVLLPEVTKSDSGLPGPPMTVKVEIRVLENVLFNRDATSGTLLRASQAALTILSALHLRDLGGNLLVAEKDPIAAVDVKKGHVSHAVTLFASFNGFVTAKPMGVVATMGSGSSIMLSGTLSPDITGQCDLTVIDPFPGFYQNNKSGVLSASISKVIGTPNKWVINPIYGAGYYAAEKASDAATPVGLTGWTVLQGTGQPTFTAMDGLTLTCATPSSSIRYTTDGSYPTPDKTLYTTPILGLQAGTVVRACAYVAGMAPGDAIYLTITE